MTDQERQKAEELISRLEIISRPDFSQATAATPASRDDDSDAERTAQPARARQATLTDRVGCAIAGASAPPRRASVDQQDHRLRPKGTASTRRRCCKRRVSPDGPDRASRGFRPRSRRPGPVPVRPARATRLTRLDIVGWPKPMPNASGTSASANSAHRRAPARTAISPTAPQPSPSMNVGLSPEAAHDWTNDPALDHGAKHTERGEEVAGLRRVEPESPRREQRERRLKDGEREPIDEIDREHAPDDRPSQQGRQIPKRVARAGAARDARFRAARATPSRSRRASVRQLPRSARCS